MIRVLLVDDHRLVRAGLQSLLDACDDIQVVGSAADGQEALELVAEAAPDVVLMDLSMPRMGGVEAARRLLADHPNLQVVVLTSFSDQEQVHDAVEVARSATCSRTPTRPSWSRGCGPRPPASPRSTPRWPGPCSPAAWGSPSAPSRPT
jgi:DNA-binding NarL/FixJ family response regulator